LRSDDNPEKLKNRLAVFRTEIPQVQAHYEAMGLLRVVNGNQHPEKVYAELKGAL
jgi:adenylate kinase family enzyme